MENTQQHKEAEAMTRCRERVAKLGLKMKPILAHYTPEDNHITIYFRAQARVDFRKLVRELSRSLKTRVELRQVGPRDQAKLVGTLGKCGYPLCCQTFLKEFAPTSIKMAKQQNLVLNPSKISGVCGRLLCCLSYENAEYLAMKEKMPRLGEEVATPLGQAKVVGLNLLKETVSVTTDGQTTKELPLNEIKMAPRPAKGPPPEQTEAAAETTPETEPTVEIAPETQTAEETAPGQE